MTLALPECVTGEGGWWQCDALTVLLAAAVFTGAVPVAVRAQQPAALVPGAPSGVTAFVGVTVIPMDTERMLLDQTVLVERGRIAAVGPVRQIRLPAGATRIEGRGKYLLPGLADCHMHLPNGSSRNVSPDSVIEWRLFQLLAEGITTIRNLTYDKKALGDDSLYYSRLFRARARAASGELWSPHIYMAGPWGPAHYTHSKPSPLPKRAKLDMTRPGPRLDSIAVYLAAYKAAGYDFVKTHEESPEVFDTVLAAARRLGIPVVGHVMSTLEHALAGGMRSIEHLTGYPSSSPGMNGTKAYPTPAQVRELAEATRRAGTWNCVTMDAGGFGRPGLVRALQDAGAGLLLGSDEPLTRGIHRELELLVQEGLTPYEALGTGTINVARYFNALDDGGTVAIGKRADLVLLNGNPLENVANTKLSAGVMIGGRWLARTELDQRLTEIEAKGLPRWPFFMRELMPQQVPQQP